MNHALLLQERANAYMRSKQFNAAILALTEAIELSPDGRKSHCFYLNRAAAHLFLGKHRFAIADSERCLELSPRCVKALRCLAVCHSHFSDWPSAVRYYSMAVALEPGCMATQRALRDAETKAAEAGQSLGTFSSSTPALLLASSESSSSSSSSSYSSSLSTTTTLLSLPRTALLDVHIQMVPGNRGPSRLPLRVRTCRRSSSSDDGGNLAVAVSVADVKAGLEVLTGVPAARTLLLPFDAPPPVPREQLGGTAWTTLEAKVAEVALPDHAYLDLDLDAREDGMGFAEGGVGVARRGGEEQRFALLAYCFSAGLKFSGWDPSQPERRFRT